MFRPGLTALSAILGVVALAACSSGKTNLGGPVRTFPTARDAPATTAAQTPTTATTVSGVRIVSLTGPASPPVCNAPTQVELHWTAQHATTVTLQINGGPVFASYAGGTRDELVPLACDGNPQTYLLTAHAPNGRTATKSVTIDTRQLSAS